MHVSSFALPNSHPQDAFAARRSPLRATQIFASQDPHFRRDPAAVAKVEQRKPVIDHLLVLPPPLLTGLSHEERAELEKATICSQNEALQTLQALQPTHIFPEARQDDLALLTPEEHTQIAADFQCFPDNSLTERQRRHLLHRGVADIYAALSGIRIKRSISRERYKYCGNMLARHVADCEGNPSAAASAFPLHLLYDLPAEDMARSIESFFTTQASENARVAAITQYPFALPGHIHSDIGLRIYDCSLPYVSEHDAARLAGLRCFFITEAVKYTLMENGITDSDRFFAQVKLELVQARLAQSRHEPE